MIFFGLDVDYRSFDAFLRASRFSADKNTGLGPRDVTFVAVWWVIQSACSRHFDNSRGMFNLLSPPISVRTGGGGDKSVHGARNPAG